MFIKLIDDNNVDWGESSGSSMGELPPPNQELGIQNSHHPQLRSCGEFFLGKTTSYQSKWLKFSCDFILLTNPTL